MTLRALTSLLLLFCATPQLVTVQDILKREQPPADHRIAYGQDPLQFGDLRLPPGTGPHPVVIVIHGGCWLDRYDLTHIGSLAAALTRAGAATWSLEYRRVGSPGGDWPATFEDVARGADHVRELAKRYPLAPDRVAVLGHSAGGHLALWLAARRRLTKESPLYSPDPIRLRGVVSLAGVTDLAAFSAQGGCGEAILRLLGGPQSAAERYRHTSPMELLPLGVPQRLIQGGQDRIVPTDLVRKYESAAQREKDDVRLIEFQDAGHFELITPEALPFRTIEDEVMKLLH